MNLQAALSTKPDLQCPDYTHSILGIPNSLLRYYGAPPLFNTLPVLDAVLSKSYKNVVLMLFDGMGSDMLYHNLPQGAFLNRQKKADILSVYPCTTTAAVTTFESGLPPIGHGWLGWNCYFKEVWRCVDLFSSHISGVSEGVTAAAVHLPQALMPYITIFDRIQKAPLAPEAICEVSPFSEYRADTSGEVCACVKALCAEPGRHFIYAYHNQPDHDMHDYGCYDERIRFMVAGINAQIEALCAELTDTLIIITADHGLRDIKMLCVEDYPHLMQCLSLPISVEPRCASLFVREEYRGAFKERFYNTFPDQFLLLTKAEALEQEIFGPGAPHPKVLEFMGDYMALAVGDIGLCCRDNKGEFNDFKASHAGLDKREMTVPLIISGDD